MDLSVLPWKRHRQVAEKLKKARAAGAGITIVKNNVTYFPERDTVLVRTGLPFSILGRKALVSAARGMQHAEVDPYKQAMREYRE